ncbi:hypothetical protein C8R43DRAFT_1024926, partial [Mycena crocata]
MSAQEPKKPPACNPCRARRVLCHPQSNGAPCPRCAEKNHMYDHSRSSRTAAEESAPRHNDDVCSGTQKASSLRYMQGLL